MSDGSCGVGSRRTPTTRLFPCNPSFDTRVHQGTRPRGLRLQLADGRTHSPLFHVRCLLGSSSYDSEAYNYPDKIPEQVMLTSVAAGEGGMVTELFESYDQFEQAVVFHGHYVWRIRRRQCPGTHQAERFPELSEFQIGVSKQQCKLSTRSNRNLRVLPVY